MRHEYKIQLRDMHSGETIITAGGKVHVATGGSPDKLSIYDRSGASLANPLTPTRGFINFFVDDSVASVDLYIMAPRGQFVVAEGVRASGPNEINIDAANPTQVAKIPFSVADQAGDNEETDTGFDIPHPSFVLDRLHGCGLYVTAADATEDISVGTNETVGGGETGGDANGLIAASSVGTLGLVIGTNGALFSSNAPHKSDATEAKSITYTLSAGADTAKGFIILPYRLA